MTDIAIIDYGMGNLLSVAKAFEQVAPTARVTVTADASVIRAAARVVFPGVGAMADCMRELDRRGLTGAVRTAVASRPFLGICLGMQALFEHSEEGDCAGLGILPGRVRLFPGQAMFDAEGNKLKVPHIGWNGVRHTREHPLWTGIGEDERFYFVHGYYCDPAEARLVAGTARYPFEFACAVVRDNLFAVQFHPEKSAAPGLRLLANFVTWKV
ncbi:MAG TPA: imidazole glycerol phosphate synthase subunit HisH [Thiobacillaceae bacterium]|nr:imidazole glycerol phosphate synthase subunit HisH [Thiobacillaceae bacterium]HNU63237.1 imidazole glycerol phosphate synthase subunit HisH [Thiobacillaceae bacterium]